MYADTQWELEAVMWHYIQEVSLAHGYRHDEQLQTLLRKMIIVGFLPTALVTKNFRLLRLVQNTLSLIRQSCSSVDFLVCMQNTHLYSNFPLQLTECV